MTQVAEFKVAHLYPPYQGKGLAAIVAEDGTKYKCQQSQLTNFQVGEAVAIHYTDESFTSKKTGEEVSFKKLVSKIVKPNGGQATKQFTRAAANPQDSDRMGTMGQVNALLNGWAQGRSLDEILQTPNDKYRLLIDKMNAVLLSTRLHGAQVQRDDGMDDEITI